MTNNLQHLYVYLRSPLCGAFKTTGSYSIMSIYIYIYIYTYISSPINSKHKTIVRIILSCRVVPCPVLYCGTCMYVGTSSEVCTVPYSTLGR